MNVYEVWFRGVRILVDDRSSGSLLVGNRVIAEIFRVWHFLI
jgi:hypothetical protein